MLDYKKGFIPKDWYEKYPVICSLINSDDIQERYWINECIKALQEKQLYENEIYIARLETEANVIKNIGEKLEDCLFAYFNTFKQYIDLFWECGSIVGPGRGSATGFLSNDLLPLQIKDLKSDSFVSIASVNVSFSIVYIFYKIISSLFIFSDFFTKLLKYILE